jgi:hypothetical protein
MLFQLITLVLKCIWSCRCILDVKWVFPSHWYSQDLSMILPHPMMHSIGARRFIGKENLTFWAVCKICVLLFVHCFHSVSWSKSIVILLAQCYYSITIFLLSSWLPMFFAQIFYNAFFTGFRGKVPILTKSKSRKYLLWSLVSCSSEVCILNIT